MVSAIELLKEWLEMHDEPCWFDHHGCCQAHFLEFANECIVARTRALIEKHEANMNWEGPGNQ